MQACGDAHLANFGMFASPERDLVFDINDFDETLPGPWEWDVKRLAASLEMAARSNDFSTKVRRDIVLASVAAYRGAMREFAGMTALDVWYAHADMARCGRRIEPRLAHRGRKALARSLAKARTKDNLGALGRSPVRGWHSADHRGPAADRARCGTSWGSAAQATDQLRGMLAPTAPAWSTSVGRCWTSTSWSTSRARWSASAAWAPAPGCALMLGTDESDPLFLQAKEAGPSVLEAFVGASEYDNSRSAGGGRAAADAGRQRHLPRLGAGARARRADPGLLPAAAARLEGIGGDRDDGAGRGCAPTASCAGGPSPGRTRGRGTGSRSRPTSAPARPSTSPSASSPTPTPTRTSVTTGCWSRRSIGPDQRPDRVVTAAATRGVDKG